MEEGGEDGEERLLPRVLSMDSQGEHDLTELVKLESDGTGMARLNRAHFTPQEAADRLKFLPLLRTTLAQIDGTLKQKSSKKAQKQKPKEEHLYDFGMSFYEELFDRSPEIRDQLFHKKPPELLATKLGEILAEVVRLLAIETPKELSEQITEMALRHIAYGVMDEHVDPFKDALIACMKRSVKQKGFKWSQRAKRAWEWSLTEITDLLMDAVNKGRPRVQNLQRSWILLCERMYMEDFESQHTKSGFLGTSQFGVQSQFGAMQSMLGANLMRSKGKMDEEPKTIKIGNEAVSMPVKKSQKKVNIKKEAAKTNAQKQRERLREKAKLKAKGRDSEEPKAQAKFSVKLLAAKTVGAFRVAVSSLMSPEANSAGAEEFRMWSKKDLVAHATKEYRKGRLLVGQKFIKVFAARNPWAVTQFDFGLKDDHAEKMGEALELIVNSSTKPQVLAYKLRVLAISHVQMGIKPSMFPPFEEALFDFLKTSLSEYGEWNKPTEQSWKWMWDIVNNKFVMHMESAARVVGLIERSWKYIEDNYDLEDISDIFFKYFFHKAPGLQAYFVKPTKMQRVMLEKALNLIVNSVRDTAVLNIELKGIAMQHIKYDITADHLKIFGDVLLSLLRDTAGEDHWDNEVDEAWREVYGHIAEIFHHIISTGKNLVSRALATGNPEEMRRALDTAGRRQRVLAPLEIETDDSIISPVVWTLQEGQLQMADELLRDALAIRGDREAYYCGRERLWMKHPWLLQLLVDKAPKLLTTVLDGHLWCSRFMEDGQRRVNFYLDELYGNPDIAENKNAYKTALGIFVSKLPLSELHVFAHPVVIYLTDLKWKQFGRRQFVILQLLNFSILGLGLFYLLAGDLDPRISFAVAILQLFTVTVRVFSYYKSITRQVQFGNGVNFKLFRQDMILPYALSDPFLVINLGASILCFTMFAYTWRADPFGWKLALMPGKYSGAGHNEGLLETWADVAAFTCGMLCIQLVEAFKLTTTMSAMLFAILAVIPDVLRFMSILLLWTTGCALTVYWLMVGENLEHEGLDDAMHIDIGDGHTDPTAVVYFYMLSYIKLTSVGAITQSGWTVRLVFVLSVWCSIMMLLYLLVSNMVYKYLTLYRSFDELAVRARAELVLRAEEIMSKRQRTLFYERCMFHEKVDFDKGDDGLTGGIQELLPIREMSHPAFRILDRVERYSGSTNPDDPWDPLEMHSGPTTDTFVEAQADSKTRKNSRGNDEQDGGAIDQNLLRQVTSNFARLAQELFVIKRALGVGDDTASQGTSVASSHSRITESEDATNRPGVAKYIQQFANNLTASADQKPTNAEQEREDRPSTAQKALDVTMTVQHEMQALQANMARMMAELEALRCGQLNGKMPSIQEEAGPEFGEVGKAAVVADQRAVVGNKNANSAPEDASELGSRVDMDELDEMVKEAEANRIDPLDALIAEMDDDRLSQGSGDGDEDEDEGSTDGRPLREVTEAELATHDREESLWMGVEGMVYDLTDWVDSHPGGRGLLLGNAGTDATAAFFSAHTGGSKFPAARRLAELPIVGRLSVSLRKLHTQSPVKQPGADTAGGGPYDELQF